MRKVKMFRYVLGAALLASGFAVQAQQAPTTPQEPSVDSIIDSLKADATDTAQGQTRALRPGAASMATSAPAPSVAKPAAKAASINMQINFDFNSDRISGSSEQTMATLAKALASPQLEGRSFTVIGHTDGKGSAAYNKALSDRRAASVRRYLIDNGVSASRLRAVGKGKSELLNPSDPFAAENRRVEVLATGGWYMPLQVVNGATLMCSFGVAPSTLVVTPENRTFSGTQPAATIMDFVPMKNIMPFGMCMSPANPQVAAATAAASGVLTPQPCIPVTTPWKPGAPTVLISGIPALDNTHTSQCAWAGVITIVNPGQMTHMIP